MSKKIIQKLVFLGQFNGFFVDLIFLKEKNIKNCQFLSNNNNFKKITKNGNFLSKKCIFFVKNGQFLSKKKNGHFLTKLQNMVDFCQKW